MPATDMLCHLLRIKTCNLSKEEILLLEAELVVRICEELKRIFKSKFTEYFRLMKFNVDMENDMLEANFIRCLINDILLTEEYTLAGIAYYTHIPEDFVYEIVSGQHTTLSITFFRKIIELHRSVRGDLYRKIIKKILTDYQAVPQ